MKRRVVIVDLMTSGEPAARLLTPRVTLMKHRDTTAKAPSAKAGRARREQGDLKPPP